MRTYVNDTGNKFTFYIPDFHCNSGVGGNINNGGTYTIYSDVGATNNIGSIVVDSSNGVQELTHTTGEIYSLVTGTVAFVGANSNANVYVFGPIPQNGLYLHLTKFLVDLAQSLDYVIMQMVLNYRLVKQRYLQLQQ